MSVAWRMTTRRLRRQPVSMLLLVLLAAVPLAGTELLLVQRASSPSSPMAAARAEVWGGAEAKLSVVQLGPIEQSLDGLSEQAPGDVPDGTPTDAQAYRSRVSAALGHEHLVGWSTFLGSLQRADRATEPVPVMGLDAGLPRETELLRRGRMPTSADEIAMPSDLLRRLKVSLGDSITIEQERGEVSAQVVGELRRSQSASAITGRAGAPEGWFGSFADGRRTWGWFVVGEGPVWHQVAALNALGTAVTSPALITQAGDAVHLFRPAGDDGDLATRLLSTVGAVGACGLITVLLVGPAYGVVTQRSRRDLALLAAAGAGRTVIYRTVLTLGVLTGVGASVLSLLLCFAAVLGWERGGGLPGTVALVIPGLQLAVVAFSGIAVCVAAAVLPARSVTRMDVVAALTEQVGGGEAVPAPVRRTQLGVLVIGAGVAVAGVVVSSLWIVGLGITAAFVGIGVAVMPLFRIVGRRAERFGVSVRLAVRDASRHPRRTAPALLIIVVSTTLAVTAGSAAAAADGSARRSYMSSLAMGATEVEVLPLRTADLQDIERYWEEFASRAVPIIGQRPVERVEVLTASADLDAARGILSIGPPGRTGRLTQLESVVVADGGPLGLNVTDVAEAAAVLSSGKVVVTDPTLVGPDGTVRLRLTTETGADGPVVDWPAGVVAAAEHVSVVAVPDAVVGPLDAGVRTGALVFGGSTAPDLDQEDALRSLALQVFGTQGSVRVHTERGYQPGPEQAAARTGALVVAALTVLLSWVVIALSATEQRADVLRMETVGLTPRGRDRLVAAFGSVLALSGAVIGAVAGVVASMLVVLAMWRVDATWRPAVSWDVLALMLIAVPAVAALGALAASRSVAPATRRIYAAE